MELTMRDPGCAWLVSLLKTPAETGERGDCGGLRTPLLGCGVAGGGTSNVLGPAYLSKCTRNSSLVSSGCICVRSTMLLCRDGANRTEGASAVCNVLLDTKFNSVLVASRCMVLLCLEGAVGIDGDRRFWKLLDSRMRAGA